MVRRIATDPKTAFAGVALEISFARLSASMATFKVERTGPSFSFSCWDLSVMAETQGGTNETWRPWKRNQKDPNPNKHPFGYRALARNWILAWHMAGQIHC